jgi:STE24 endopeptidase
MNRMRRRRDEPSGLTTAAAEIDALLWTDERERERARRYHRVRRYIGYGVTSSRIAERALFLSSGGANALERSLRMRLPHEALVAPVYSLTVSTATFLLDLPAAYLGGHRIERTFGLSQQPDVDWLRQRLLGFVLGSGFSSAAFTAIHLLIRRRPDDWWLILTGAAVPASLLLGTLFPTVIMPRFNRFTPLADRDLVERLQRLGNRAGVTVADVYEMDMSRQTERANAMFTGLGGTRRIILGDTLTSTFEPDEIAGVIAHELGHQVHRDVWTLSAIGAVSIAVIGGATSRLAPLVFRRTERWTGIGGTSEVAAMDVLATVAGTVGMAIAPISALVSRTIERRTDRYAMELTGEGQIYARAMAQLGRRNLVDPDPPRWRDRLLSSHPPITERIATALAFARRHPGS